MAADRKAVERFYADVYFRGHSQSLFSRSPSATLLNKTDAAAEEEPKPAMAVRKPVSSVDLYLKWKRMGPIHVEARTSYAHDALPFKFMRLSNTAIGRQR